MHIANFYVAASAIRAAKMEVNHFLFAALVVFLSAAALCRGGYVILDSEEVLKRLKDFSFECTPEDFAEQSQKDIFTVEDCNKKGARADYDYKVKTYNSN